MKTTILILAIAMTGVACSRVYAQTAPNEPKGNSQQATKAESAPESGARMHPYLGLGVEAVPPALATHLGTLVGDGKGVLVAEVTPGSPAEKAGIKRDDVLASYDDQKLYSPDQFVKMVRHDKIGRQVTLGVVRGGKLEQVNVSLGEIKGVLVAVARDHRSLRRPLERLLGVKDKLERNLGWSTFDSMTIARVDDKRFKAEIKYRDKEGKIETRHFEGTREEIAMAIEEQKDLPADEREHLKGALGMAGNPLELQFNLPDVHVGPSGGVVFDFDKTEQR